VVLELAPVADTYIEAVREATWSHGGSDHMDVDEVPEGITYLRFDLTAVGAPVRGATLRLHCSNPSSDGGTVYPVGDSTWLEGTAKGLSAGSAGQPGLTFNDVDTNLDGTVSAADASPYVPDFGTPIVALGGVKVGPVAADVTAAFQAGPRVYTLAIRNRTMNGATYSSREHPDAGQRPALVLTLGAGGG
jgi:hypothetical protein